MAWCWSLHYGPERKGLKQLRAVELCPFSGSASSVQTEEAVSSVGYNKSKKNNSDVTIITIIFDIIQN